MKVYDEPVQLRLPQDASRSLGLHLSTILKSLALEVGILDQKYDTPIKDSDELPHLGLAWENYLADYQLKGHVQFHPGEFVLDGIAMSPDGLSVTEDQDYASQISVELGTWLLHEFKLTLKSSRDFKDSLRLMSPKVLLWLWQIMAYRYALNMSIGDHTCLTAKLYVLFVRGDYSKDMGDESKPRFKTFRLVFTQQELEENWTMILSHRDTMMARGQI